MANHNLRLDLRDIGRMDLAGKNFKIKLINEGALLALNKTSPGENGEVVLPGEFTKTTDDDGVITWSLPDSSDYHGQREGYVLDIEGLHELEFYMGSEDMTVWDIVTQQFIPDPDSPIQLLGWVVSDDPPEHSFEGQGWISFTRLTFKLRRDGEWVDAPGLSGVSAVRDDLTAEIVRAQSAEETNAAAIAAEAAARLAADREGLYELAGNSDMAVKDTLHFNEKNDSGIFPEGTKYYVFGGEAGGLKNTMIRRTDASFSPGGVDVTEADFRENFPTYWETILNSAEDAVSWAEVGNTDRIPKDKLPSDTAYGTIPSVGNLATKQSVTDETARAKAAEAVNASAITAETTRAKAAEGVNASAAATARSVGNQAQNLAHTANFKANTNATAIADETARAQAKETELETEQNKDSEDISRLKLAAADVIVGAHAAPSWGNVNSSGAEGGLAKAQTWSLAAAKTATYSAPTLTADSGGDFYVARIPVGSDPRLWAIREPSTHFGNIDTRLNTVLHLGSDANWDYYEDRVRLFGDIALLSSTHTVGLNTWAGKLTDEVTDRLLPKPTGRSADAGNVAILDSDGAAYELSRPVAANLLFSEWSSDSGGYAYKVGDLRFHNGLRYICIQDHTKNATGPDGDLTNWAELERWVGEIHTAGYFPAGAQGYTGSGDATQLWIATEFVVPNDPLPTSPVNTKWRLVSTPTFKGSDSVHLTRNSHDHSITFEAPQSAQGIQRLKSVVSHDTRAAATTMYSYTIDRGGAAGIVLQPGLSQVRPSGFVNPPAGTDPGEVDPARPSYVWQNGVFVAQPPDWTNANAGDTERLYRVTISLTVTPSHWTAGDKLRVHLVRDSSDTTFVDVDQSDPNDETGNTFYVDLIDGPVPHSGSGSKTIAHIFDIKLSGDPNDITAGWWPVLEATFGPATPNKSVGMSVNFALPETQTRRQAEVTMDALASAGEEVPHPTPGEAWDKLTWVERSTGRAARDDRHASLVLDADQGWLTAAEDLSRVALTLGSSDGTANLSPERANHLWFELWTYHPNGSIPPTKLVRITGTQYNAGPHSAAVSQRDGNGVIEGQRFLVVTNLKRGALTAQQLHNPTLRWDARLVAGEPDRTVLYRGLLDTYTWSFDGSNRSTVILAQDTLGAAPLSEAKLAQWRAIRIIHGSYEAGVPFLNGVRNGVSYGIPALDAGSRGKTDAWLEVGSGGTVTLRFERDGNTALDVPVSRIEVDWGL